MIWSGVLHNYSMVKWPLYRIVAASTTKDVLLAHKKGVSLNLERIQQLKQLGYDSVHRVELAKMMYLGEMEQRN